MTAVQGAGFVQCVIEVSGIPVEVVRSAIASRLGWIRRQQARFSQQERQSERSMVTGETHYVWGRCYLLNIVEHDGAPSVRIRNNSTLEMRVRHGSDRLMREEVLLRWHRERLRAQIEELIPKWEEILGVSVAELGIKRMKTRWGSCNVHARRVWLNLELAKKPIECVEYVLVHEMAHLRERRHDDRFKRLMDRSMPQWRIYRDELNRSPHPILDS